jgi:hypothetical protein
MTISFRMVTIVVCLVLVWMTTELRRISDSADANLMSGARYVREKRNGG